jgi:CspA family cold shock protein
MAQGVVKSYDPNTGNGIVILDTDKTEVFLAPGSLKGSIFRTLRQGQRVNFDLEQREEIPTIVNIRIGQDKY